MDRKTLIGILAVAGALAFGACEQNSNRAGTAERGGSTSAPASRSPSGDTTRVGTSAADRGGTAGMVSGPSDMSGTGGAGDAGMGHRDAGMR